MAYRSQLVIRTSAEEGARTLERVKALAEKEGRTISEIALELLARGLDSDLSAPAPAAARGHLRVRSARPRPRRRRQARRSSKQGATRSMRPSRSHSLWQ